MRSVVCRLGLMGLLLWVAAAWTGPLAAEDGSSPLSSTGNRLAYLDANDPFYPGLHFPRLTTPQWVGEAEVEAVVILSIDDMRDPARYEAFLRPILERLQAIDGRAPVSIMVNAVTPDDPQLSAWLTEGLSLEIHTLTHPCPCLAGGNFEAAANTYHGGVDLLNQIPGNRPLAFRMPCCDSMNSPSPRFYAEIFNRTNSAGQFLTLDSSVMNLPTTNDPALRREWLVDADGRERFRKYFPTETNSTTRVSLKSFVTTIEDYPYPYVIGKLAWEFPATVPSDWEAFNLHGATNATTLADWKTALDLTVLKQGVLTLVFHPHGWSSPEQFVELIDYAVQKHGRKVKFLSFREAQERLDRNLLGGHPLRGPDGADQGVRLLDLNNDGFMDVVIGHSGIRRTRIWDPAQARWHDGDFPAETADLQFGIVRSDGAVTAFRPVPANRAAWRFDGVRWVEDSDLLRGLEAADSEAVAFSPGVDRGVRFRDVDRDGRGELIFGHPAQNAVFGWSEEEATWKKLPFTLPPGTSLVDEEGRDAGLRFVDINEDGYDDVLFSNEREFSLHLFVPKANPRLMWQVGWHDEVFAGQRGHSSLDIPKIVRDGPAPNNGVWFARSTLWVQNEDTSDLPDRVDRRTFRQLLAADEPPALSPEESLQALQVADGFQVELVASEPLVMTPIAFDWGADGRLWVVEMGDYPMGLDGKGQPGGRIKFLEDLDGDGRYDRATVFLDGIGFPTGVMPWRQGVLVSAAPEIFYAEDTDGDGRADRRETLFTGFVEGNQQHRLNGFDYGLDNWVYGANGDSGGQILYRRRLEQAPVNISGRDFRFRPDTGEFEAVAGMTQFGRHRDDWDNWFGNSNPIWLWHFHLPEHYLARNPHLAVPTLKRVLANYPDSTRLYPASRTRQRFNDHHHFNHVTSANSPTPYRDELFGPEFATSVFISDPVHNLVHREVLTPDGVSFVSQRAASEANSEFLASADNWFRPIMLKTGPDGALYVADMYRQVLEHPEWIPAHVKPRLDLRAGADRGRIYRVFPQGAMLQPVPRLDSYRPEQLVAALESPNGWQRDTAQRLLVHGGERGVSDALRALVRHSPRPKTRLQALWTLEGLGTLTAPDVMAAWTDSHPSVREHSLRLAEPLAKELAPFTAQLEALADDPDRRVRYQLAFTLGADGWPRAWAGPLLVRLATRDFDQADLQVAILSSAPPYVGEMLHATLVRHSETNRALLEQLIGLATALKADDALAAALHEVTESAGPPAAWQLAALAAMLDVLEQQDVTWETFTAEAGPTLQSALRRLERFFPEARELAAREPSGESLRRAAIQVLGRFEPQRRDDVRQLAALLRPEHSGSLQQAAVQTLAHLNDPAAAEALLAGWNGYSPALREEALAALLGRREWTRELLDRLESETIPARQLGAAWQDKLLRHTDTAIRERAAQLFSAVAADREDVLKSYAGVSQLSGDPDHGIQLYRQHCATCHRLGGEGRPVGPDLGMIANKSVPALLEAILDPNRAVEARYVGYLAVTRSGREVSGIITSETPNNLTLRTTDAREETLLRAELEDLSSSGLSLMPEGFETALSPQDLADLISALTR